MGNGFSFLPGRKFCWKVLRRCGGHGMSLRFLLARRLALRVTACRGRRQRVGFLSKALRWGMLLIQAACLRLPGRLRYFVCIETNMATRICRLPGAVPRLPSKYAGIPACDRSSGAPLICFHTYYARARQALRCDPRSLPSLPPNVGQEQDRFVNPLPLFFALGPRRHATRTPTAVPGRLPSRFAPSRLRGDQAGRRQDILTCARASP